MTGGDVRGPCLPMQSYALSYFITFSYLFMALNSLLCADVPLSDCSLTFIFI